MSNWTYLRFNSWGDSNRRNVFPNAGTYVWGFDLYDHKVKVCFQEKIGRSILKFEDGHLDDDCQIVAWAPIEEGKTEPNLEIIKRCGIYWPPRYSLEYERKRIRVYSHMKATSPRQKKQIDAILADARAVLANAAKRGVAKSTTH